MAFRAERRFGIIESRFNSASILVASMEELNRALTRIYESGNGGTIQVCGMIPLTETIILQDLVPEIRILAVGNGGFFNSTSTEFPLFTFPIGSTPPTFPISTIPDYFAHYIFTGLTINQLDSTNFSCIFYTEITDFTIPTFIEASEFSINKTVAIFDGVSGGQFVGCSMHNCSFTTETVALI